MKLLPGDMVMDLTIPQLSIRDELNQFWIKKDDLEDISFRGYRKDIKRAFAYLSYKHDRKRSELERLFVHLGVSYLYGLPGVIEIKEAKHFLIANSDNGSDENRSFDSRHFDLGTDDTTRYHNRILESDKSQVMGLAETLGLSHGVVCQMAFVFPLLQASIPTAIHNDLLLLFNRFCQCVQEWGYRAQKVRQECRMTDKRYRIPIDEILPISKYGRRLPPRGQGGENGTT